MRADKIRDVDFTTVIVDTDEFSKSLEKIVPGQKPSPSGDEPKAKKTVDWVIGQSGSLLIVSDAPKDVEKVLALQSGAAVPSLAEQAAFTANAPMARGAQTFAWVNVKPIMATLARRPETKAEGESLLGAPPSMERILNATVNQTGLLGFGGDRHNSYSTQFEGTASYLISKRILTGVEYRTKPSNLGFAKEDDWFDAFVAYAINKNLSVTVAYADLGDIATFKNQRGVYVSLQAGF